MPFPKARGNINPDEIGLSGFKVKIHNGLFVVRTKGMFSR